jgi:hypothetical protein
MRVWRDKSSVKIGDSRLGVWYLRRVTPTGEGREKPVFISLLTELIIVAMRVVADTTSGLMISQTL